MLKMVHKQDCSDIRSLSLRTLVEHNIQPHLTYDHKGSYLL